MLSKLSNSYKQCNVILFMIHACIRWFVWWTTYIHWTLMTDVLYSWSKHIAIHTCYLKQCTTLHVQCEHYLASMHNIRRIGVLYCSWDTDWISVIFLQKTWQYFEPFILFYTWVLNMKHHIWKLFDRLKIIIIKY